MEMPRGEPTKVVTVRIDERLAASLEERAAREGKTISDYVRQACEGTFRYPGKVYTWAESEERRKALRQVDQWRGRTVALRAERETPARLLGRVRDECELPPELREAIDAALSA
jgi:hypothetical protein